MKLLWFVTSSDARSASRALQTSLYHALSPLTYPLTRKQCILVTQILAAVRLSETDYPCRIQPSSLRGTPSRDSKPEGNVILRANNYTGVLDGVVGELGDVGLGNVRAVEEWHNTVGTNPDLVASVFGDDGEGGYVQTKFASFGEFSCEN